MANVKLFGLVLIITSLLLGMAALGTHTTSIRFGDTGIFGDSGLVHDPGHVGNSANSGFEDSQEAREVNFVSVPVAYPLLAAGCLGLVLWFLPEVIYSKPSGRATSKRRSRRRR